MGGNTSTLIDFACGHIDFDGLLIAIGVDRLGLDATVSGRDRAVVRLRRCAGAVVRMAPDDAPASSQ